jgi:hypothetical protein
MSELEIKELQNIQSNIEYFSNELRSLESSKRYTFGIGQSQNNKCGVSFPNGYVNLNNLPGLPQILFDLINERLTNHLNKLIAEREKLIICTQSSSITPFDILDKE